MWGEWLLRAFPMFGLSCSLCLTWATIKIPPALCLQPFKRLLLRCVMVAAFVFISGLMLGLFMWLKELGDEGGPGPYDIAYARLLEQTLYALTVGLGVSLVTTIWLTYKDFSDERRLD